MVVLVLVAGCGGTGAGSGMPSTSSSGAPTSAALPPPGPVEPIAWKPCPADVTIQCGTVLVPVDYLHPLRMSISLAVTQVRSLDASDPGGALVFNPGGPGESGNQILPVLVDRFPAAIHQRFDLVTFDPRGTGASDPLRCGTAPSALISVDPVPASAHQPLPGTPAFTAMARACRRRAASLAPFIDTTNTARDLDRIRQSLGLTRISYYGMSYGTALGSVYADLFPRHVATMVLDGAVDINASLTQQAVQEAPAAEQSLDHLLATCVPASACPLGADPRSFFRSLVASMRRHPLPAPGHGDTEPVTVGDLDTAGLFAVSVVGSDHAYESALVAAASGDGGPLRSLALQFATDIDGSPLVDALWAITCNDAPAHPGPVAAGDLARSIDARYPLIGAYSVTYTMGGCVAWPSAQRPVTDVHPTGAPPVMVIGNTGDPNTPLIGARHLATIFPAGSLVIWRGWGHTWLLSGSGDTCMQDLVSTYLTGGGLPATGTTCN